MDSKVKDMELCGEKKTKKEIRKIIGREKINTVGQSKIWRRLDPFGTSRNLQALTVALTTANDRSSQAESIRRRFLTSEFLDGFWG